MGHERAVRCAPTASCLDAATGRRGLALIGEGTEIEMGREADGGVTASMGLAVSPGEDGVVILQLDDSTDPRTALKAFLAEDGVDGGRIRDSTDRGVTTSRATFKTATEDGTLRGEAAFIEMDGTLYSLVGYASTSAWRGYSRSVRTTLSSFQRLTDQALLDVQPRTIDVVTLREAMSVRAFHKRTDSPIPVEQLARMNRVDPDDVLPAGRRIKRVLK